jgi:hypothetical protein
MQTAVSQLLMISLVGDVEELAREVGERLVAQFEQEELRERMGLTCMVCCSCSCCNRAIVHTSRLAGR